MATRRATLPRSERLRGRDAIQELFRRGARLDREACLVLWMPVAGPRVSGFLAGRRLIGSVGRNRARRLLREAYRREKHRLPEEGVQVCLLAHRRLLEMEFTAVAEDVAGALGAVARRLER